VGYRLRLHVEQKKHLIKKAGIANSQWGDRSSPSVFFFLFVDILSAPLSQAFLFF